MVKLYAMRDLPKLPQCSKEVPSMALCRIGVSSLFCSILRLQRGATIWNAASYSHISESSSWMQRFILQTYPAEPFSLSPCHELLFFPCLCPPNAAEGVSLGTLRCPVLNGLIRKFSRRRDRDRQRCASARCIFIIGIAHDSIHSRRKYALGARLPGRRSVVTTTTLLPLVSVMWYGGKGNVWRQQ